MHESDIILRLLMAAACGGLIGIERERGDRPAGFRTYILVTLGACLFTIVSFSFGTDTARIAAGIVTGIGFIGAGSIIGSKAHIKGVTTAATLWIVAAIGLAVGTELYLPAVIASVLVFLVLQLRKIEEELEDRY